MAATRALRPATYPARLSSAQAAGRARPRPTGAPAAGCFGRSGGRIALGRGVPAACGSSPAAADRGARRWMFRAVRRTDSTGTRRTGCWRDSPLGSGATMWKPSEVMLAPMIRARMLAPRAWARFPVGVRGHHVEAIGGDAGAHDPGQDVGATCFHHRGGGPPRRPSPSPPTWAGRGTDIVPGRQRRLSIIAVAGRRGGRHRRHQHGPVAAPTLCLGGNVDSPLPPLPPHHRCR